MNVQQSIQVPNKTNNSFDGKKQSIIREESLP